MMDTVFNPGRRDSAEDQGQLRVTDRRRIHLDEHGSQSSPAESKPERSLKPTYVEELETRTKAAENRVAEVQSRFEQLRQQLQKEVDETRQRLNRAAEERSQREKAEFIATFLPIRDNLELAIRAATDGGDIEQLAEGVRLTASNFETALANAGVESIPTVGQDFDPRIHEAVDTVAVEEPLDGKVVKEYSPGFKIGERLLRPARVQVGRAENESTRARR
jgi:molecular chaperone GrpE